MTQQWWTEADEERVARAIFGDDYWDDGPRESHADIGRYGPTKSERIERARAALAAMPPPGWRPIETAPRDGRDIFLGRSETADHDAFVSLGRWEAAVDDGPEEYGHDAGFADYAWEVFRPGRSCGDPKYRHAACQPTHYMPLPAPPEAER